MGLAWQQGPLGPGSVGRFLTPDPLPERLLFAEPLRRRMRVRFGETWIAQSDDVVLLHEPARYPVAFFPKSDIVTEALHYSGRATAHRDLGPKAWYLVRLGGREAPRGAWEHTDLPGFAEILRDRVAFAWHAMDAFYEEDERILGHAADPYHRIDIRQTSRELIVRAGDRVIAESHRPLVLYESGFAPRWYAPREDINQDALELVERQTFCPYKGICSYYDIGGLHYAAWSYRDAYREVERISDLISFEPDKVTVLLDGVEQHLAPGERVVAHGPDRDLTPAEAGNVLASQP
ncbi:MAG TPA: DUF427 domain-containing protein [Solirubrobacteraceae bacterium]|nr:DUF427 domain-containing protein [Solirubrobacteraceae bacterium]